MFKTDFNEVSNVQKEVITNKSVVTFGCDLKKVFFFNTGNTALFIM